PLEKITYILFDAGNEALKTQWLAKCMSQKRSSDMVTRLRGEAVEGAKGTLGEAREGGSSIKFDNDSKGKPPHLSMSLAHSLVFIRENDPKMPKTLFKLHDTSRNFVHVAGVESTPTGYTVTTPMGVKLEYKQAQVARFDYSTGKIAFLSKM